MSLPPPRPSADEEILRATHLRLLMTDRLQVDASNWNYELNCPFWRIYVNNRPGAFIAAAGKRRELWPGRVMCIPAWQPYSTASRHEVQHDYVHFEWSGISAGWLRHCIPEPVELELQGPLLELCRRWQEGLATPGPLTAAQHVWTQAWIYAVVAGLLDQGGEPLQRELLNRMASAGRLRPALEQVDARLHAPAGNEELAALCGMSTDHFIKCFRQAFGSTPAQYQLEQRITQAASWLAGSDMKLEEIAARTGFTDRFHFSRAFRARLRESPAAYRRKFKPLKVA